jgi:gas vesicle protein
MNIPKTLLITTAVFSVLALSACEQEKVVQAPAEPAPAQPAPAPVEKPAVETAKEGIDMLRDAANQALKEVQPAIDDARKAAEQALKDAQPAIDQAWEAAGKLGASVSEIVSKAQEDLKSATEALEQRIREAQGGTEASVGDPAAVLPPADKLRADSRAAARAASAAVGPAYVGVWAGDAATCGRIDVEPVEMMAVITPTTSRRYESLCNFAETPISGGAATLAASCVAEGDMEDRQIKLTMPDNDTLVLDGSPPLVRCHLPG